jgi:addiction module HigA family antidote
MIDKYQINPFSLSKSIGMAYQSVANILTGKRRISTNIAIRLVKYFGNTPKFWLDIQAQSEITELSSDKKFIAVLKKIPKVPNQQAEKHKIFLFSYRHFYYIISMLSEMMFFGDHKIDFTNNDIESVEYNTIIELQKIPIPAVVLDILEDSLISNFLGNSLSKLVSINKWCPISFPQIFGIRDFHKDCVNAVGPMCMHIIITSHHIQLPAIIYAKNDFYSPDNLENIQSIRSYYHSIIIHFGGTHALYTFERLWQKYYPVDNYKNGSALLGFEENLIAKYGITKKSLFKYSSDKFPRYYIDTFQDLIL